MRTADNKLSPLGKVFIVACSILVVVLAMLATLVVLVVRGLSTDDLILDQGQRNQRHIDCIVASASASPPAYCVEVIQHLRDEGILRPTTIPLPTTTP